MVDGHRAKTSVLTGVLAPFYFERSFKMIRTISGAIKYLKEKDPECPVTEYMLKKLVKSGQIPSVKPGSRSYYVSTEALDKFFNLRIDVD